MTGTTKLTSYQESIVRNAKNDVAISAMLIHSQPERMARQTKFAIARGRKSCTSPNCFMACVSTTSPPVPVATTNDEDQDGAHLSEILRKAAPARRAWARAHYQTAA